MCLLITTTVKPFGPGLFLWEGLDFFGGDKNVLLVISLLRFPVYFGSVLVVCIFLKLSPSFGLGYLIYCSILL